MSQVIHNKEDNRFEVQLDGGEDAVLKYRVLDNNIVEYFSTFVPKEARGQGLAEKLVDEGVQFAKDNNYKIKPTCWYVDKYLDKHPEHAGLRE